MTVCYDVAGKEVRQLMDDVIAKYQHCLAYAEVKIDVLMAIDRSDFGDPTGQPALKLGGYPCAAIIKINPLKQRVLGLGDALITIDEYIWNDLTDEERMALLDHELEHLEVKRVGGGVLWYDPFAKMVLGIASTDDAGRPRLSSRLHDWELGGFKTIARRWGENALEVQAVHACKDNKTGQYFWNFGVEAEPVKPKPKKVSGSAKKKAASAPVDQAEETTDAPPQVVVMYSEAEKNLVDQVARIRRILAGETTAKDLKFRDELELLCKLIPDDGSTITVGKWTDHEVTLGKDEKAVLRAYLDDNPAEPAGDEE